MKGIIREILIISFIGIFSGPAFSAQKPLLRLTGSYFAYSYDLNHLYGEDVAFDFLEYQVSARYLKISLSSRSICAFGEVTLSDGQGILRGDELFFSVEDRAGVLLTFGETVTSQEIGEKSSRDFLTSIAKDIERISLAVIQKSLIYFTAGKVDISQDYEATGYGVTMFLEGIESVSFAKLNMTSGFSREIAGISIEKIWFNKTQGLITRLSHSYEKKDRFNLFSHMTYEERSILKDYTGPKRQIDLMTSLSARFGKDFTLMWNGNYNSSNLWNMNALVTKKWSGEASSQVSFAYNKPIFYRGEAWLGLQSSFQGKRFGGITAGGKFGKDGQFLGDLSYSNALLKKIRLNLMSSYSSLRPVGGGEASKIWTSNISATYVSSVFNLSTDYFLNRDLVGHQSLSQPRLQLSFAPQSIYDDILTFNAVNMLIFNESISLESKQRSYSNNLIFSMMTAPIFITDKLRLNINFSLEQLMEKSRRNFVSSGIIFNVRQEFSEGIYLEGYYSAQSRRRTQGWMVEGTTSQDLSLMFRVDRSSRLSAWFSVSYDPKYQEFRNSFGELSCRLFGAWGFHALGTYDFRFMKINNVDLYIVRKAGRFQLRFVWRSLSRQFLVELMPR